MLIDTTLREGAQLFGAYFNRGTKEHIISGLLALDVNEVEIGWVGQEDLKELATHAQSRAGQTKLGIWSPCRETDIRAASELPIDRINIGVPVSDMHIQHRLGTDHEGLLERIARTVLVAGLLGIDYISVGLEDVSRADEDFAIKAALLAQDMGASRIRLSDSLGVLTPLKTAELVAKFRAELDIELAVHCHNDFGMGTANAITALQSGADYADVSVLGIGERSGIAATEELAAYLTLKEKNHAYDTHAIRDLCDFVSTAAGVPITRTKPVAGQDIFACESGLHAHALSKSPALFEPYNPDAVSANRTVAVGGKSGRSALRSALIENDIPCPDHRIPELVTAVKNLSWKLERPLTASELTQLANSN